MFTFYSSAEHFLCPDLCPYLQLSQQQLDLTLMKNYHFLSSLQLSLPSKRITMMIKTTMTMAITQTCNATSHY